MEFRSRFSEMIVVLDSGTEGNPPRLIRFRGGVYRTENRAEIAALRANRFYGVDFVALDEKPPAKQGKE